MSYIFSARLSQYKVVPGGRTIPETRFNFISCIFHCYGTQKTGAVSAGHSLENLTKLMFSKRAAVISKSTVGLKRLDFTGAEISSTYHIFVAEFQRLSSNF